MIGYISCLRGQQIITVV
uniref:Uncharacterized protein n=1 Tax=Arundo donax TaxID=35708 RepID=A0A0A9SCJ0_ARUDO